jgi:hypothetical protein
VPPPFASEVGRPTGRAPGRMLHAMERPTKYEEHRFVGDKRSQVVYDLDADDVDPEVIAELMEAGTYLGFGPDTLPEARNRGYRLWKGHSNRDE